LLIRLLKILFFPKYRHKDFWATNSWAGGLTLGGDQPYYYGRNQESISEAANAYYAVYLLGLALKNNDISNFGRLLLATEIRSALKYYFVRNDSQIYPPSYQKYKLVGILWTTMVQYQTWFGTDPFFIHSIQALPVTPISEELFADVDWVKDQYGVFESACVNSERCKNEGWVTFLYLEEAIFNPDSGLNHISALPDYVFDAGASGGNGNSRTNSIWWALTRNQ